MNIKQISVLMSFKDNTDILISDSKFSETLKFLKKENLIEDLVGGGYTTTNRGDAFIALLCGIKLPKHGWLDEFGDKIVF